MYKGVVTQRDGVVTHSHASVTITLKQSVQCRLKIDTGVFSARGDLINDRRCLILQIKYIMKKLNTADAAAKVQSTSAGHVATSSKSLRKQIELLASDYRKVVLARSSGEAPACLKVSKKNLAYNTSKAGVRSNDFASLIKSKDFQRSLKSLFHKANIRHSETIKGNTFDWFLEELVEDNLEEVGFVWSYGQVCCLLKGVRSMCLREAKDLKDPVLRNVQYSLADFLDNPKTVRRVAKALNRK
jgi:hypothetical protein